MNYNIQFIHTSVNSLIEEMVIEKLNKLGEKFDWATTADVFFKVEKADIIKGKICEIRLNVPGQDLFASSNEESFEMAISETTRDLTKQLIKRRDKMRGH